MITVLIVDNDLGFVFWLGQTLDEAGYEALPAKGMAEARSLLREVGVTVDVLIADPATLGLPGFLEDLRQSQRPPKLIGIGEPDARIEDRVVVSAWRRRPSNADELSKSDWVRLIQELARNPIASNAF